MFSTSTRPPPIIEAELCGMTSAVPSSPTASSQTRCLDNLHRSVTQVRMVPPGWSSLRNARVVKRGSFGLRPTSPASPSSVLRLLRPPVSIPSPSRGSSTSSPKPDVCDLPSALALPKCSRTDTARNRADLVPFGLPPKSVSVSKAESSSRGFSGSVSSKSAAVLRIR